VRLAEVHLPRARLIVAIAALTVSAAILWLSRGFNFYFDEWTFILSSPDWTWTTFLQAHNGHPVLLPRLIYAALLGTVGMHSYLPYMAALLILHATAALLLFELVRRRSGDLIGLACAALLLVLGAGWENLLWAFQLAFVGSVAFGLGTLLAVDAAPSRSRMPIAAALLLASIMFSGIGLFFGVAAAVALFLQPDRRRDLLWLAPVAIAFGAWYLTLGRSDDSASPGFAAANLPVLPFYVLWGLGTSVAGLFGQGGVVGPVTLVLAAIAVGLAWRRHRPDAFTLGAAAALVTFYVVTGLSRAQLGYQQAGAGRYVYEGAVFWLLLLPGAARDLPWRATWRPALVACLFLACFSSSVLLYTYAVAKTEQMRVEMADLHALASVRSDPCLNPSGAVDVLVMPQVNRPRVYYRAVDRYGDPAGGQSSGGADFARARANLLTPGCK
jgi:hypothetical protein